MHSVTCTHFVFINYAKAKLLQWTMTAPGTGAALGLITKRMLKDAFAVDNYYFNLNLTPIMYN